MGIMRKLILAKLCSLISSIFDLIGIGSFEISQSLDDTSNRLMGRETNSEAMDRWRDNDFS